MSEQPQPTRETIIHAPCRRFPPLSNRCACCHAEEDEAGRCRCDKGLCERRAMARSSAVDLEPSRSCPGRLDGGRHEVRPTEWDPSNWGECRYCEDDSFPLSDQAAGRPVYSDSCAWCGGMVDLAGPYRARNRQVFHPGCDRLAEAAERYVPVGPQRPVRQQPSVGVEPEMGEQAAHQTLEAAEASLKRTAQQPKQCSWCRQEVGKHDTVVVLPMGRKHVHWECAKKDPDLGSDPFGPLSGRFEKVGRDVGKLVDDKNAKYGDSFYTSGQMMRLLYPDGVSPDQYEDMLGLARVWDKMKRIATAKDAYGESPWRDIAGYAILAAAREEGE